MPDARRRADSRIRTDDLIITNDLLYQLSYIGIWCFLAFVPRISGLAAGQGSAALRLYVGPGKGGIIAPEKLSVKWDSTGRDSGKHRRYFCHSPT